MSRARAGHALLIPQERSQGQPTRSPTQRDRTRSDRHRRRVGIANPTVVGFGAGGRTPQAHPEPAPHGEPAV